MQWRLYMENVFADVFSQGALLPTIVQSTGFMLSFQDNITYIYTTDIYALISLQN